MLLFFTHLFIFKIAGNSKMEVQKSTHSKLDLNLILQVMEIENGGGIISVELGRKQKRIYLKNGYIAREYPDS